MKPYGYFYEGRFYRSLHELRGFIIPEKNKPVPIFTEAQVTELIQLTGTDISMERMYAERTSDRNVQNDKMAAGLTKVLTDRLAE
jgi:hypothetical protein